MQVLSFLLYLYNISKAGDLRFTTFDIPISDQKEESDM